MSYSKENDKTIENCIDGNTSLNEQLIKSCIEILKENGYIIYRRDDKGYHMV